MTDSLPRLGFLASHNGTSAKAIAEACFDGHLNAYPALMLSNNESAQALKWATAMDIPALHVLGRDEEIKMALKDQAVDFVILSGYMKLIGPETIKAFPKKIINIHPALLPHYGGKGMYGRRVHEAVKTAGETETGITIHYVDSEYDSGDIIAQETIPLSPDDSAEDIEVKVKKAEPEFFIRTLQNLLA